MTRLFGWLRSVPALIAAHKKRIGEIGVFYFFYIAVGWLFDNIIWIYTVYSFGFIWGNALMTALAILINAVIVFIYNKNGYDWAGIEEADRLRKKLIRFFGFGKWAENDIFAFIILSVQGDAFLTSAYMRHGDFSPLVRKDFFVFVGSVLLSCAYWSLRNSLAILIVKAIERFFGFL